MFLPSLYFSICNEIKIVIIISYPNSPLDPFLQLPGQLHGRCQGWSHARLSSQWSANHRTAKKVLCTHAGNVQVGEETPPGFYASYGGG